MSEQAESTKAPESVEPKDELALKKEYEDYLKKHIKGVVGEEPTEEADDVSSTSSESSDESGDESAEGQTSPKEKEVVAEKMKEFRLQKARAALEARIAKQKEDLQNMHEMQPDDVKKRLRAKGLPATLFGETSQQRRDRMVRLTASDLEGELHKAETELAVMAKPTAAASSPTSPPQASSSPAESSVPTTTAAVVVASSPVPPNKPAQAEASSLPAMNDRQKKLFELRLRLNQSRKMNHQAVVAEARREVEGPEAEYKRARAEFLQKRKLEQLKKEEGGASDEPAEKRRLTAGGEPVLEGHDLGAEDEEWDWKQISAEQAQRGIKKKDKKKKKRDGFMEQLFGSRRDYNAYKRRLTDLPMTFDEYKKKKEECKDMTLFFPGVDDLRYGETGQVNAAALDRLTKDIEKQQDKRGSFSRRRQFFEEEDVDHINERNRTFNKKLSRFFDKYTVEIKQNLERGTAV